MSSQPSSVPAGDSFSARAAVKNVGRQPAQRSLVRFLLSLDRSPSTGDVRLGKHAAIRALDLRKSSIGSARLLVPAILDGSFFVIACADSSGKVRERVERNNCRASRVALQVDGALGIVGQPGGGGTGGTGGPGGTGTTPQQPAPPPAPPTAPTGLVVTSSARTQLVLDWNAVSGADGYRVYRATSPFELIGATTGSSSTSFTTNPLGLPRGTDVQYMVRAFGAGGESGDSNVVTQVTAPAQPAAPTADATSPTTVDVSWAAVPTATSYKVLRAEGIGPFTEVASGPGTTFNDTTANAATTYVYRIVASNSGGDSDASDGDSATTPPATLAAPTALNATSPAKDRIDLTWSPSAGATSYKVQRGNAAAGPFTDVGTSVNTSFSDSPSLQPATEYFYRVVALATGAESGPSNVDSAITRTDAPQNLRTQSAQRTSLVLEWDPVPGATGYQVYRSDGLGHFDPLNPPESGGSNTDSVSNPESLPRGTNFDYKVRALNSSGESTDSNVHTQITAPATPGQPSVLATGPHSVNVDWADVPTATSYVVLRATGIAGTPGQVGAPVPSSFTDSGATDPAANTTYVYSIAAVNGGGQSLASNGNLATTDVECDGIDPNENDQSTAKNIGTVSGDAPQTVNVPQKICRGDVDWFSFDLTETDGPTDEALEARIDFEPGGDVNGKEEKLRMCVFDGIGNPDGVCSPYGVSIQTPPPFFFTNSVFFTDNGGTTEVVPVFVMVDGELPSSNGAYTVHITGDP